MGTKYGDRCWFCAGEGTQPRGSYCGCADNYYWTADNLAPCARCPNGG